MKTTVIFAEKKSVASKIAQAISPEKFEERGVSDSLFTDIVCVRRLPYGEFQENPGTHYFNSFGKIPFEFRIESIGSEGPKNVRRSRQRIKFLNEHAVSDLTFPVVDVLRKGPKKLHEICEDILNANYNQIQLVDDFDTLKESVEEVVNNLGKYVTHDEGIFDLTKQGRNYGHTLKKGPWVPEDINYYILQKNNHQFIILDTDGNPLRYYLPGKGILQQKINSLKHWDSLKDCLKLMPSFDDSNIRSLKSHVIRTRLFSHILSKRKLPYRISGNSKINLEKVIAATDEDTAGSWIFQSIIEYANEGAQKYRGHLVNPNMLFRMDMDSLDASDVQNSLNNLDSFDWNNGYGGKMRAIFDFTYGSPISANLKYFGKPKGLNLSVGRNLFLGMKELAKAEAELNHESMKNYVYIAFKGYPCEEEIQQMILNRDFVASKIVAQKNKISLSSFIERCEKNEIGTHTTRYRIADKLKHMGLLESYGGSIFSTKLGAAYMKVLSYYVENNSFSLDCWNKNLHRAINMWGRLHSTITKEEVEKSFNAFGEIYFDSLQRQFNVLSKKEYQYIVNTLQPYKEYKVFNAKQKATKTKPHHGKNIVLDSLNSCISLEHVKTMIDENSCSPKSYQSQFIERNIQKEPLDFEYFLRKNFVIKRDFDFSLLEGYNLAHFFNESERYTVFRSEVSKEATLADVLINLSIQDTDEFILDSSKIDQPEVSAHSSLRINDIHRSDIQGKDGFRLVNEFHEPWYYSQVLLDKQVMGGRHIKSMNANGLLFNRQSWYDFGEVHNFESLLTIMFEKYNFPFWKTAKMAEEFYLNII